MKSYAPSRPPVRYDVATGAQVGYSYSRRWRPRGARSSQRGQAQRDQAGCRMQQGGYECQWRCQCAGLQGQDDQAKHWRWRGIHMRRQG